MQSVRRIILGCVCLYVLHELELTVSAVAEFEGTNTMLGCSVPQPPMYIG